MDTKWKRLINRLHNPWTRSQQSNSNRQHQLTDGLENTNSLNEPPRDYHLSYSRERKHSIVSGVNSFLSKSSYKLGAGLAALTLLTAACTSSEVVPTPTSTPLPTQVIEVPNLITYAHNKPTPDDNVLLTIANLGSLTANNATLYVDTFYFRKINSTSDKSQNELVTESYSIDLGSMQSKSERTVPLKIHDLLPTFVTIGSELQTPNSPYVLRYVGEIIPSDKAVMKDGDILIEQQQIIKVRNRIYNGISARDPDGTVRSGGLFGRLDWWGHNPVDEPQRMVRENWGEYIYSNVNADLAWKTSPTEFYNIPVPLVFLKVNARSESPYLNITVMEYVGPFDESKKTSVTNIAKYLGEIFEKLDYFRQPGFLEHRYSNDLAGTIFTSIYIDLENIQTPRVHVCEGNTCTIDFTQLPFSIGIIDGFNRIKEGETPFVLGGIEIAHCSGSYWRDPFRGLYIPLRQAPIWTGYENDESGCGRGYIAPLKSSSTLISSIFNKELPGLGEFAGLASAVDFRTVLRQIAYEKKK